MTALDWLPSVVSFAIGFVLGRVTRRRRDVPELLTMRWVSEHAYDREGDRKGL